VRKVLFLLAGAGAIIASYMAVIFGLAPAEGIGSGTVASIALPALVSGLVFTAFIAMLAKSTRDTAGHVHELHAQLARKEVEITRLASHDELTGLYSRHHFDETVGLEFERAKRHDRPFSVLLVQLDDLEGFAERAGSLSKGYVLSEVASLLRTALRINDTGGRYTDDCLAVLLPETDALGADVVAERVRAELAKRQFFGRGKSVATMLTVSQGIAAFPCAGVSSHHELQKAAELALAQAKSAGGGGIRAYAPPASDGDAPSLGSAGTRALAS
jgi:diguanylate cyclase (GGDEF)-like protein